MKTRHITLFTAFAAAIALAPAAQAQTIIPLTGASSTAGDEDFWEVTRVTDSSYMVSGEGATGLMDGTNFGGWFGSDASTWFRVDLGASYDVGNMYVWNGQPGNSVWDRGVGSADIYYSTSASATGASIPTGGASSGDWILITAGQSFNPKANDLNNYLPTDTFNLGVNARVIGLYVTQGFGGNGGNSLAQLQFFTAGSTPPAAADLEITEIDYAPDTGRLTLTWNSSPNETYRVDLSTDLIDWDFELDNSFPAAADADADETTATFDLNDNFPEGIPESAYFRVEKN